MDLLQYLVDVVGVGLLALGFALLAILGNNFSGLGSLVITDKVVKEKLEDTTGLLVDQAFLECYLARLFEFFKVHILRRPQNLVKSPPYFRPM